MGDVKPFIKFLVLVVIVCLGTWLVVSNVPMSVMMANVVEVVAVLIVILAGCRLFGLWSLVMFLILSGPDRWA
jgi:hypothetical protein